MTKSIVEEAKKNVKRKQKEANAMSKKNIWETVKTIVITILVTGIATFVGGFVVGQGFQKEQTQELKTHIESITLSAASSDTSGPTVKK